MWFKQAHYFQMTPGFNLDFDALNTALENLFFEPCLPSLPHSVGWVSPVEQEDMPLVYALQHYVMICLQIEEKILPSSVIQQALQERIKILEKQQGRKIFMKEKNALKADIISVLMPRAFTKQKRIYAYIDTQRGELIINTIQGKEIAYFLSAWSKVLPQFTLAQPELKEVAYIMTHWVQHQSHPEDFAIEKACVLQDPSEQSRTIRCQQQSLLANAIQSLIDDGCRIKQLALSWQDQLEFTLTEDFLISGLKFQDKIDVGDAETAQQQFDSDFFVMTQTLTAFFKDLLLAFGKDSDNKVPEKTHQLQAEAMT